MTSATIIPKRYCTRCGREMSAESWDEYRGFSSATGEKVIITRSSYRCPQRRWYDPFNHDASVYAFIDNIWVYIP